MKIEELENHLIEALNKIKKQNNHGDSDISESIPINNKLPRKKIELSVYNCEEFQKHINGQYVIIRLNGKKDGFWSYRTSNPKHYYAKSYNNKVASVATHKRLFKQFPNLLDGKIPSIVN